jgi:hypothetical protein
MGSSSPASESACAAAAAAAAAGAPLIALLLWLWNIVAIFIRALRHRLSAARAAAVDAHLGGLDPRWPVSLHRVSVPGGAEAPVYELTGWRAFRAATHARLLTANPASGALEKIAEAAVRAEAFDSMRRGAADREDRLYVARYRDAAVLARRPVEQLAPREFDPAKEAPVVLAAYAGSADITAAVAAVAPSLAHGLLLVGDICAWARVQTAPVLVLDKNLREYHFT